MGLGSPTDLHSSQRGKKKKRASPAGGSLQISLYHRFCKCGEAKVPLDGAGTKDIYLFIVQGTPAVLILRDPFLSKCKLSKAC